MKKNILAILVPALMLVGCGSDDSKSPAQGQPEANPETGATTPTVVENNQSHFDLKTRFVNANVFADKDFNGFPSAIELIGQTDETGSFHIDESVAGNYDVLVQAQAFKTSLVSKPGELIDFSLVLEAEKNTPFVSPFTTIVLDEAKQLASRNASSVSEEVAPATVELTKILSSIDGFDSEKPLEVNYLTPKDPSEKRLALIAKSLVMSFSAGERSWGLELLPHFVTAANKLSEAQLDDTTSYLKPTINDIGEGLGYIENVELANEFSAEAALTKALSDHFNTLVLKQGTALVSTVDGVEQAFISLPLKDVVSDLNDTNIKLLNASGEAISSVAGLSVAINKVEESAEGQATPLLDLVLSGTPQLAGVHTLYIEVSSESEKERVILPYQISVEHQYEQVLVSDSHNDLVSALSAKLSAVLKTGEELVVDVSEAEVLALFKQPVDSNLAVSFVGSDLVVWDYIKNIPALTEKVNNDDSLDADAKAVRLETKVVYIKAGDKGGAVDIQVSATLSQSVEDVNTLVSSKLVDIATVHVLGSTTATTLSIVEGKTFALIGDVFGPASEKYQHCSLVRFEGGSVFASTETNYLECDPSAPLAEVGTYNEAYEGILVNVADKQFVFSATEVLDADGQPQGFVTLSRKSSLSPAVERFSIFESDQLKDKPLFDSQNAFANVTRARNPNTGTFYQVTSGESIWRHSESQVRAFFIESANGSERSLHVQFNADCDSLNFDKRDSSSASPIVMNSAYTNTGAELTSYKLVNNVEENYCVLSYDLSEVHPNLIMSASYIDISFERQPMDQYFLWTAENDAGSTSISRSRAMNFSEVVKLRVQPETHL